MQGKGQRASQQTLSLLTKALVRKRRLMRWLLVVAVMLPIAWVGWALSGVSGPVSPYLYIGVFLLLYALPAPLVREYTQLGERAIEHVRDQQLIARGHWPEEILELLLLMECAGWPQEDGLRLWWWRETHPILVRWLPRLQPGELGPKECRTLRKLLHPALQEEDLQVVVLLALGTARDKKARRMATKLLRHSPHERVREAARECLKEL